MYRRQETLLITAAIVFLLHGNVLAMANEDVEKDASWKWGLGASFIYQQLREETLHKLRNQGPAFSWEVFVTHESTTSTHQVMIHLPVGVLFDRYDFPAISIQYGIEGLGLWHSHKHYSFGYMATANVRYRYFPEWDDSHLYWLTDYTLGPALQYQFRRYPQLTIQATLGLTSVISRSPQHPLSKFDNILTPSGFFSVPQQDFQFRHLGNFQTGKLRFDYDTGEKGSHRFHYETRFARVDDELQFVEIWHSIGWRYVF